MNPLVQPLEVRSGYYRPDTAIVIEKVYEASGVKCRQCQKKIAARLPCLYVAIKRDYDGHRSGRYLHDRCLGKFLLEGPITNEGDIINGLVHHTIINNSEER